MGGRCGRLVVVGALALGAVVVMDGAPVGAQAPPTVVIPPGAVAGDQALVSISGTGCPDQEVTVRMDTASLPPGEVATDAVAPPVLLGTTTGAPDGTWSLDVSMELFGRMVVIYGCGVVGGSTEVIPDVDPPLVMTVTALPATQPGTVRYRVSGSGCPGPVVRVGAVPDPLPPDVLVLAVGTDALAPVQADGTFTVEATHEAWPELGAGPTGYRVLAACYAADSADYVPVIWFEPQAVTLTPMQATTTTAPAVGVTPTFTG